MPATATAQNKDNRLPFERMSSRRVVDLGLIPYSSQNITQTLLLPKVGYLARLFLTIKGTMNLGAGAAFRTLAPWNLLKNVNLSLNQGMGEVVNVSGYDLFLRNTLMQRGYRPDRAGVGDATPQAAFYSAPLATGDNAWTLNLIIPVAVNMGRDAMVGLLNLQAPEVECTLKLTWATGTEVVTNVGTGFTGNCFVAYEYWEAVSPELAILPVSMIVRQFTKTKSVTGTGELPFQLDRLGTLLNLNQYLVLNDARSEALNSVAWKINNTDTFQKIRPEIHKLRARIDNSVDLPTGVFQWDFQHAEGEVSTGWNRDAINTQRVTTIETIYDIISGTTLGSGNNFLYSTSTVLQRLKKSA